MDISLNKTPKKRGRKPKNTALSNEPPKEKPPPKKRGRKPKGGKIFINSELKPTNNITISNIILHLKCSLDDLIEQDNHIITETEYNPAVVPVVSYTENNHFVNLYEYEKNEIIPKDLNTPRIQSPAHCCKNNEIIPKDSSSTFRIKISEKINKLQHDLIINDGNINTFKHSCCFWDSDPFETDPIYIPKNLSTGNKKFSVYGCFCSPECAAAYLMNENINDSEKFERYHLLNFIYGKIYNYNKPIRPAPNPYFTLSKFMGNLTIDDYRNLFEYEKMLLVIEKPLTRSLPQLVEDNDNFQIAQKNSKINTYSNLRKKNSISKNEILTNNFGS